MVGVEDCLFLQTKIERKGELEHAYSARRKEEQTRKLLNMCAITDTDGVDQMHCILYVLSKINPHLSSIPYFISNITFFFHLMFQCFSLKMRVTVAFLA